MNYRLKDISQTVVFMNYRLKDISQTVAFMNYDDIYNKFVDKGCTRYRSVL